ncbi:flagellar basal body rod protein FlgB [Pseudomethylobacillus aquaticus]|uniref:flagellar basal body rod protein FlgB n=1 Tax=Pseudomethylobacillus aquaticus TaxID=2676064 RepID=UPI00187B3549|nr:flagellar basal body protein [Pseudomethylobacillus aquaticus]
MINQLDAAFNFQQTALRLRAQRQELLSANIANADTPNFKARDMDFAAAMQAALNPQATAGGRSSSLAAAPSGGLGPLPLAPVMGGSLGPLPLAMSSAQHRPLDAANAPAVSHGLIQYRNVLQGSVDNNTVDMDIERAQFADNAVRYEASLTMLNGQIKKLMSAIQG